MKTTEVQKIIQIESKLKSFCPEITDSDIEKAVRNIRWIQRYLITEGQKASVLYPDEKPETAQTMKKLLIVARSSCDYETERLTFLYFFEKYLDKAAPYTLFRFIPYQLEMSFVEPEGKSYFTNRTKYAFAPIYELGVPTYGKQVPYLSKTRLKAEDFLTWLTNELGQKYNVLVPTAKTRKYGVYKAKIVPTTETEVREFINDLAKRYGGRDVMNTTKEMFEKAAHEVRVKFGICRDITEEEDVKYDCEVKCGSGKFISGEFFKIPINPPLSCNEGRWISHSMVIGIWDFLTYAEFLGESTGEGIWYERALIIDLEGSPEIQSTPPIDRHTGEYLDSKVK